MREGRARQHRDRRARADLVRHIVEQLAAALPRCPSSRGSAASSGRASGSSTARICWAGVTTSQASRLGQVGEIAGRADRRVELHALADRPDFRGSRLTAVTTSSSSAHSKVSRPPVAATCASAVPQAPPPITRQPFDAHAFTPAPRTFSASGSSGQRARAGASSPSTRPGGEALGPGPADHRRIVGAQPARRHREAAAIVLRRAASARSGPTRWRQLRRRRPGSARRDASSARRVRSTKQSTTACWKLAAISSGRCSPAGDRALHRGLEAGEAEMRLLASRPAGAAAAPPADRRPWPAPRSPARRDRRGRAAWPPCRTPRPPHRRWSSQGGDNRRRRAPRATGNGRRWRAAADRESRASRSTRRGLSAWPSRWLTAISGLPADSASPLPTSRPTITPPISPGPAVAAMASTSPMPMSASCSTWRTRPGRISTWARAAISGTTPPNGRCASFCPTTACARICRSLPTSAAALSSQEDSRARINAICSAAFA